MFGKKNNEIKAKEYTEDKRCLSIVYNRFYLQMNKLNQYMNASILNNNLTTGKIVAFKKNEYTTGFPTLKIDVKDIENCSGSYIAIAKIGEIKYKCVAFVCKKKGTVELYLIDCKKNDFVGQDVEVNLVRYIRDWQDFNSNDKLSEAISSDLYVANIYFKENGEGGGVANPDQNKVQNTLF